MANKKFRYKSKLQHFYYIASTLSNKDRCARAPRYATRPCAGDGGRRPRGGVDPLTTMATGNHSNPGFYAACNLHQWLFPRCWKEFFYCFYESAITSMMRCRCIYKSMQVTQRAFDFNEYRDDLLWSKPFMLMMTFYL